MEQDKDKGLIGIRHEGTKSIYTHAQDVEPIADEARKMREGDDNNGFTENRSMRHIGRIPEIEFFRNPVLREAVLSGDPEFLQKAVTLYLKTEGSEYATVTKGI